MWLKLYVLQLGHRISKCDLCFVPTVFLLGVILTRHLAKLFSDAGSGE